jgi:hypothetical protein
VVIAGLPLIFSTQVAVIVVGATAAIYLPYAATCIVVLWARLAKGWPHQRAAFNLGKWGIPITVLAALTATALFVDLVWARDVTNPVWKLGIRVAYWIIGLPAIIGAIYYLLVQRKELAKDVDPEAWRDLDPGAPAEVDR